MDSEACKDGSNACRDSPQDISDATNKESVQLARSADRTAVVEPITPVPNRELIDLSFINDSPIAAARLTSKVSCFDSTKENQPLTSEDVGYGRPQTPKDVVFDPFAPGPDNMAMAPLYDAKSISDEEMIETVYKSLLEAIILKQTEDLLAEMSNVEWDSECCKTPPVRCLTGIAETCPAAPMKHSYKSRKIDLGLIRKLEF